MLDTNTSRRGGFIRRGWTGLIASLVAIPLVSVLDVCGDQPKPANKPADDLSDLPDVLDEPAPKPTSNPKDAVPASLSKLVERARDVDSTLMVFTKSGSDRGSKLRRWIKSELNSAGAAGGGNGKSTANGAAALDELVEKLAQAAEQQPGRARVDSAGRCQDCGLNVNADGLCPICDKDKIKAKTTK